MFPYSLIDIGANLTHESFADDLPQVLDQAHAAGVVQLVVTGSGVAESQAALALAQSYPGTLFATAGVHPHHAKDWLAGDDARLAQLLSHEAVRAVGECGLDHFRNFSTPAQQEDVFRRQLELACDGTKPVFLHQRDAQRDFLRILDEYLDRLPAAVAHCFTGNASELDACLERGLYIGITGWICDERRGHHLRELVGRIPHDKLMIETDAPYLLPRDLKPRPKSRRNEPRFLPHVLEAVATAAGQPAERLAAVTTANARGFFSLPEADNVGAIQAGKPR